MRILAAAFALLMIVNSPLLAQDQAAPPQQLMKAKKPRNLAALCAKPAFAKANPRTCAKFVKQDAPAPAKQLEAPTRPDFTADDQAAAIIPGVPDARFWADSEKDFLKLLPASPGPWLALSTGGGDGAFGAGLLSGWSQSGKRPEFSVV